MSNIQLCPRCGCEAELQRNETHEYFVECTSCKCMLSGPLSMAVVPSAGRIDAIDMWNRIGYKKSDEPDD